MKYIAVLGSTGSIGRQALDVIAQHPDVFQAYALTAQSNAQLLLEQAWKYKPAFVGIADHTAAEHIRDQLPPGTTLCVEDGGLIQACNLDKVDTVLIGTMGFSGLAPLVECIKKGKRIALANKESIVCGGALIQRLLREYDQQIFPVDSEHCGVFQCLQGIKREELKRIVLTASGGPFRSMPKKDFHSITAQMALQHPHWSMGPKITIDSATLMNKGFEVIEARWLFDLPVESIDVVIHPESIVHALIESVDGAMLAQLNVHDMRIAIQYALTYPDRIPSSVPSLNLMELGKLTFEAPDVKRFPCLRLAYDAMDAGGVMPVVLNAANEVAVQWFLQGSLRFNGIPLMIEYAMNQLDNIEQPTFEDLFEVDAWTRCMLKKNRPFK